MDIGLASIRVSSHAKQSIRNVLISSNIMLSGPIKSRDLHTSMSFVLDEASFDEPKAAPTNVAHVPVDIHEDLMPEFSPDEIFVFLNKLVMKKVPDDTSIASQFCVIQRGEIFLHEYRIHPQYIRVDVEIPEEDINDFMTSILKIHPLTTFAPNIIALPIPWSTQKYSFSISTDRSFQKKVSVLELYEFFISSPNMKMVT